MKLPKVVLVPAILFVLVATIGAAVRGVRSARAERIAALQEA